MSVVFRVACCAVLTCALLGCPDNSGAPLRVGLSIWPPNEMAYLARERSLFAGLEVELIDLGAPTDYLPGYVSGGFDVAAVTLGSALEVASVDDSHRIVMLIDYSNGGDALVARGEIKTGADLKGKRIGYEAQALSAYLLSRYLSLIGLGLEDVVLVPMDYVLQEKAFLDGDVDALATWEPQVSRLVAAGGHVITDSSATPREAMDVIVVRESVLRAKRAQMQAFVDGWFKALEFHDAQPAEAGRLAEERKHVSQANYLRSFENIVMLDRAANRRLLHEDPTPLLESLARHRDFLEKLGLVTGDVEIESIIDASLILESS